MLNIVKVLYKKSDGELLVLKRSPSHQKWPEHLDLPGGCAEGGESPTATAVREFFEETGCQLMESGLELLFNDIVSDSRTYMLYGMTSDGNDLPVKLSWEHCAYCWLTAEELLSHQLPPNADPYFKHVIDYLQLATNKPPAGVMAAI